MLFNELKLILNVNDASNSLYQSPPRVAALRHLTPFWIIYCRQQHRNLPPKALDEEEAFFLEALEREEQSKQMSKDRICTTIKLLLLHELKPVYELFVSPLFVLSQRHLSAASCIPGLLSPLEENLKDLIHALARNRNIQKAIRWRLARSRDQQAEVHFALNKSRCRRNRTRQTCRYCRTST